MKTTPRSEFVTVMAWISLALGLAGVASGIVQGLMLLAMPTDRMVQELLGVIAPGVELPSALRWTFAHLGLLNFLSLLSSALFAAVSYGLLKRLEWGRMGFVLFLAASALAGLLGAFALVHVLSLASGMASADIAEIDPTFEQLQSAMKVVMVVAAILVAILHGAIIWKLYRAEIRAEFTR
ncbi:MAG: hypothetical protein ABI538_08590 [Pseudoxanthomonas sp.]